MRTPRGALALAMALAVALGWLLAVAARPAGAAAEPPGARSLPEDEPLLFALRLDDHLLSEDLEVWRRGGRYYVPFGELCRLLDVAIELDLAGGRAAGFVLEEKRRFELDLGDGTLAVGGEERRFERDGLFQPGGETGPIGDLYVDSRLIEEWLPLRLEVRPHELEIVVVAREKLPLQLRLERERKLALQKGGGPATLPPSFDLPYELLGGPFVDASLRFSRRAEGNDRRQDVTEYSLAASGDLLFLEANLFLYGDQDEILDGRLSLGRKDPEGDLLGPLRAREITLGEIFHPGLELTALPRSGPGFLVSSYPLGVSGLFGRESFRGDLPPGWEAELYRGEELLAYTRARPDGLYEFLDVPLLFGPNFFRIELYGPQGQRRTEVMLRNVGDALAPPGKVYYRVAGNDPGTRLFGEAPPDAGPRASFELSTGLTRRVSASFGLASVEFRGRRSDFAQAGLRAFGGPLLASLDLAADDEGHLAWQADLQSRWRRLGIQLEHAELRGLESERFFSSDGNLRRRTWLRFDTVLPSTSWLPRLPFYLDLRQDRLASGRRLEELFWRFSAFGRGLALSHQLALSRSTGGDQPQPPRTAFGQLLVSKYLYSYAFRGAADYQLEPRAELTALAATAEWRRPGDLLLSAGASRLFASKETRYQLGASKLEGALGYTLIAEYGTRRGWGGSAMISVSLARDSRDGRWHHQARPMAFAGGLSARAFLDQDGDGVFGPGETPVAGAGLRLGGGGSRLRTGENGQVFIADLAPNQSLAVALAPETLEDPYWQPASDGVLLLPRPGKVAVVDFPVQVAGEISGTIRIEHDGRRREAPGIELELVAADGRIAARTRTAADGFYDLDRLRPGRYVLRVNGEQAKRLRLAGETTRDLVLAPGGTVLDDVDLLLVVGE